MIANFEEVFPNQNIFVCICDPDNLKYIKRNPKVNFIRSNEKFTNTDCLKDIEKIVIHFLTIDNISFIEKYLSDTSAEIYWSVWGGDAYNEILYSKGYDIYYDKKHLDLNQPEFRVKEIIKGILQKPTLKNSIRKSVDFIIRRVDYFIISSVEYDLINKHLGQSLKGKCIPNSPIYYPIQDTLGVLYGKRATGNNIMIGNSASFTNNHVYAFNYLAYLNTNGRKKITPVSYGGSSKYIKYVKEVGVSLWGADYEPLEKFMPLDDYNKLMLSVSHYVYGNWRQEAVGNIVIALYLGAKVFVSEKSPLIEAFNEFDIHLYCTEKMTQDDLDAAETEETVLHNREAIMKLYSKESILNNIKRVFG